MRIGNVCALARKVFRFDPRLRFTTHPVVSSYLATSLVLTPCLVLAPSLVLSPSLVLTPSLAASPVRPDGYALPVGKIGTRQGVEFAETAAPKSEAAEAWDAVKQTTNPALLEAFIKRFGTTFFAELAKARLDELKATAAKPPPLAAPRAVQTHRIDREQKASTDGLPERAVLYEEDPSNQTGRQSIGSVTWRTESVKATGKADELSINADVDIPSRGLRMTMSFKRNLDPRLPASHEIELTFQLSSDFGRNGIANVPGILMKFNQQARGMPLAGLTVNVTSGVFLVGLSNTVADRERNLKQLVERAWFDIPIVYTNQRRAILAIDKGASGEQVFKTALAAWGQYPDAAQSGAALPDGNGGNADTR